MGLDAVELVMAFEEAFDIQIEDADAAKMRTPRDVIDYVMAKIAITSASVCLTHRAFNLLRKSLLQHAALKRQDIKPSLKLASFMPKECRRDILGKVSNNLGIRQYVRLILPRWALPLCFTIGIATGIAAAMPLFQYFNAGVFLVAGIVTILVTGLCAYIARPLSKEFPPQLQTVGDLSRWIMTHKPDLATVQQKAWTREQVAARVREIVIEQLGCGPHYREDAKFVEELGMY